MLRFSTLRKPYALLSTRLSLMIRLLTATSVLLEMLRYTMSVRYLVKLCSMLARLQNTQLRMWTPVDWLLCAFNLSY